MPTNTTSECASSSRLFNLITDNFPDVIVTQVQRKYFNESKGK
jgi:hypothetical protein